jgi:hypothetical protein
MKSFARVSLFALVLNLLTFLPANAQVQLLAVGQLTGSTAGSYADLSGLTGTLENGVPANLLGGLGSGLAWASGNTFLAIPDRGPNAVSYDSLLDDTVTYINRFHTISMDLEANPGSGLPFTLTPTLSSTTLLYNTLPLTYGSGAGLGVGPGRPAQNTSTVHYFSGRSDNFDPNRGSGNSQHARLDPESIRLSNDGQTVYISDEYGPFVYQFDRATGERLRSYRLPSHLYVLNLSPMGATEISSNTSGRTANKGMEGLAITPDGKNLVGMMQAALIQDAAEGGLAKNLLRIVTINIASGALHEYAYLLTNGSGASDIVALNSHEFLVDERDGKGLGDGTTAKIKQIFKIDLAHAVDVSQMDGLTAAANAVNKTLFLDIVQVLTANGITADQIPAKLEGLALASDVDNNGVLTHTLYVANDNDFLQDYAGTGTNPNQFYVFGFTDTDLAGSKYAPQRFTF